MTPTDPGDDLLRSRHGTEETHRIITALRALEATLAGTLEDLETLLEAAEQRPDAPARTR